jgi:hypothetical protein
MGMLELKPWYQDLRRTQIVDPIMKDPRETGVDQTRLGKPTSWVFNTAIGGGQADFDKPVEDLTPRDRVMLYAFFNQKGHVEELVHAFSKLWPAPSSIRGCTVIDVGCGPFTAGLALANVIGSAAAFQYFGVDTSLSMQTLARELEVEVRKVKELHERTTVDFVADVTHIPVRELRAEPIFVVLSYLLASASLDVAKLTADVLTLCDRATLGSVNLFYTNTTRDDARKKYPELRERLADAGFRLEVEDEEVLTDGSRRRSVHYALFHRPARVEVPANWLTA